MRAVPAGTATNERTIGSARPAKTKSAPRVSSQRSVRLVFREVLRDLRDHVDRDAGLLPLVLNDDGVVDGGQVPLRKFDVENRADHLDDPTSFLLRHFSLLDPTIR